MTKYEIAYIYHENMNIVYFYMSNNMMLATCFNNFRVVNT